MRVIVALSAALAVAGCQTTQAPVAVAAAPLNLNAAQTKIVKDTITKAMKDPDSVRFGDIYAAQSAPNRVTVCGYVNAKNSYGGYVGMSPFYGVFDPTTKNYDFGGAQSDDLGRQVVRQMCGQGGVVFP